MAPAHVVLCAMLRQMDVTALAAAAPASPPADLYRVLAAQEMLDRRETLLRGLRQRGALALEVSPGESPRRSSSATSSQGAGRCCRAAARTAAR